MTLTVAIPVWLLWGLAGLVLVALGVGLGLLFVAWLALSAGPMF